MKEYVINQFHFYGAFIAGDNFDIHNNSAVTFYQGQHLPTNTPTASTADIIRAFMSDKNTEDITPSEDSSFTSDNLSDISNSIIFTKKAKAEHKEPYIIQALQKSVQGRKDKTRAFVQELQEWQEEGYVDAHYNAQVMYDELYKLMPLPFGYEVFKKHYNNTRY